MAPVMNLLLLALPLLAAAAPGGGGGYGGSHGGHNTPAVSKGSLDWKIRNNHGRKFAGVCTDKNTLSDPKYEAIVKAEYGQVTPENSMKWESTEPNRGNWTLDGADYLVKWAGKNNKSIRAHTLVWHSQLPQWVKDIQDPKELEKVMIAHIHKLAGRYRGKIYAWDVVNEVFNEDGTYRSSVFYDVLGKNFIKTAFREAHKADPYAKLYINDYNLDFAGGKVDAMIALVKELKKERVPIHGIGSQAHLILNDDGINYMHQPLKAMAATGVEVALTEIDVRIPLPTTPEKLADQKRDYNTIVKACLSVKNCVGVTTWGVTDKYSWVPDVFEGEGDALLWDAEYKKKPSYKGTSSALDKKRK